MKLCANAERKKKERNHTYLSVCNLVGEIRNIQTKRKQYLKHILFVNIRTQSTEKAKVSAGYSSQLQIYGGSVHLK